MLYIVGMGPGNRLFLTKKAKIKISESEILIGGKRHINSIVEELDVNEIKELFYITSDLNSMKSYILENKEKKISVLASGDPSLYGIGDYIIRNLSDTLDIEIIPGISSIQYCFSRFNLNMNDVFVTSSHGRKLDYDFLFLHDKIAMVTDKKIGPKEIAVEIKNRKLNYNMYVGENLSYENEKLYSGKSSEFLIEKEYQMCVVILEKYI